MKRITKIILVILMVSFSINTYAQSEWIAPESADAIVNPLKNDKNSIKQGKKIYLQFCAICHGDKGKGDGLASAALNPKPANFGTVSKVVGFLNNHDI